MRKIIAIALIVLVGCTNESDIDLLSQDLRIIDEFPGLGATKISTIGDSRFISYGGIEVRRSIDKSAYNDLYFVGSLEDKYGFGHDAVGGDGSPELLERYDDIPNADIYVILFGTNDLWMNDIQVPFETLSFVISNKISKGSKVYYCKQTPRDDYRDAYHIELDEAIINEFDGVKGFEYIDLRTPLLNSDGTFNYNLYDDHVHPNSEGGRIMGIEIANKLNTITFR